MLVQRVDESKAGPPPEPAYFTGRVRMQNLAKEGGVVIVPAGVVHMHGATDAGAVCHIASRAANGPTEWDPSGVPAGWSRYTS